MKTPKILIVDDSRNMRLIVNRFTKLQIPNAEILEAPNGMIAETVLQEQALTDRPIDIIILDWMMPEMSGFELLKKIRNVDKFRESPRIIMLTAETYSEQLNAAMAFDVTSYITKPFTSDDLGAALQLVIEECQKGGIKNAV